MGSTGSVRKRGGARTGAVRKAVIPVAGLGTRFLPATKNVPKELLPIVDRPAVQYVVEEAVAAGIEGVVFITGMGKGALEDHFDVHGELEAVLERRNKTALLDEVRHVANLVDVLSVRQKRPLGLGHAVLCGAPAVGDEPFAVLLGDDLVDPPPGGPPCIGRMVEVFERTGKGVVALMEVPREQTHMYGVVTPKGRETDRVVGIADLVEKPRPEFAPSNLAVIGRYVLPGDVFRILRETRPGHGAEIQLTDALRVLAAKNRLVGYRIEGTRHDAGDKLGFLIANVAFGLKRPELRAGLLEYLRTVVE